VAVWASESKSGLGSSVAFESNLHRKDKIGGRASPASSAFAPKSFELTIALTEDGKRANRVALPLGVTTLAIAGDECEDGKPLVLDLPVLSLQQARPLAPNKNGLSGYPMICISEKASPIDLTGDDDALKRKKIGLKRFFSRKNDLDEEKLKYPTVAERNAFTTAYSTDGTGDAILRVSLEVYEKGSDLARRFEPQSEVINASETSWIFEPPPKSKRPTNHGQRQSDPHAEIPQEVMMTIPTKDKISEIRKQQENGKAANERSIVVVVPNIQPASLTPRLIMMSDELKRGQGKSSDRCEPIGLAPKKLVTIRPTDSSTTQTSSGTSGTSFDANDRNSLDPSQRHAADSDDSDRHFHLERVAEGAKVQREPFSPSSFFKKIGSLHTEGNDTFNDDYTLSFTKKEQPPKALTDDWEPPSRSMNIFGRKFEVPTCGAWAPGLNEKVDDKSNKVNNDDLTYVTADFFGRDVQIPTCSAIKPRDDETVSASTFTNGWTRGQHAAFVDKLCRSSKGDLPDDDEESLSWITNLTQGTQSKKKLSLKDYVRLSLTSNLRSDSQTLNSLISTEDTTVDEEDASYIEEITVDEDGTATLEARETSEDRGASVNESSKLSDRIEETVQSHAPAVRTEAYSKRIADPLSTNIPPQQVPSDLRPSMSQHFAELFTCRTSSTTLDEVVKYEPFVSDVPPVILHNDDFDNASLGDLTANTHEKNINARIVRVDHSNNNNKSNKAGRKKRSANSSLVPLPVAFGGDGLCLGAGAAEHAVISTPIAFDDRERNSILSLNPSFENYFADYDDYSILSPEAKAQALAEHTKIMPSFSSASYKEKIVLIAPASPMSQALRREYAGKFMRESDYESMEVGHEVNEKM
jgi:hypothetical protein